MKIEPQPSVCIALTTVSTRKQADDLARRMVQTAAAACVQIDGPITSVYRYDGLQQESEYRLTIKSHHDAIGRLRQLVEQHHPYEEPQWIELDATTVASGYHDWVVRSTRPVAND